MINIWTIIKVSLELEVYHHLYPILLYKFLQQTLIYPGASPRLSMKRYVLTGGPGSGKSTLILSLELSGEYVTKEGATDYIQACHKKGIEKPWMMEDFQLRILEICLEREANIPPSIERVFHDRGIPDGLAYQAPGTEIYRKIQAAAARSSYDTIFLVGLLDTVETNKIRRENEEDAKRLEDKFMQIYREHGYEPVFIGKGTVEERVSEIKRYLSNHYKES